MLSIFKFSLPENGTAVQVPKGANFRLFGMQRGIPCVWFEVDPDKKETETIHLIIYGTGHPIPDKACHLQSVMDGNFVWHLYNLPE